MTDTKELIARLKEQCDRDAAEHCPDEIISLQREAISALETQAKQIEALGLALETERGAANLYARSALANATYQQEAANKTPVAYLYHDSKDAHSVNPMLHSALLVFPCDRRPNFANETPLYTSPQTAIADSVQDAALLPALKELVELDFGAHLPNGIEDEMRLQSAATTVRAYVVASKG